MYRVIRRIEAGGGEREHLDMLLDVANNIEGRTICAFGDAAAWPVQGFLKHYRPRVRVPHRARPLHDLHCRGGGLKGRRAMSPAGVNPMGAADCRTNWR